ncbi:hypothetical protein NNO04_18210 [Citrobacter sp. Awk 4]|uniref:hypothetical protein n=1 Tax=Citrobacter sp. Awk 4 TaxID=2963955 RepID=UPI002304A999|nr:hypothetical protein [Citrobacter sp. Awk 4]MDA8480631.1 hypothetical protein [Citrobacter sp. Awk 4]
MGYYEEETRALNAILLLIFTMQTDKAFAELEQSLHQLAFPPAVRHLCENALQNHIAAQSVLLAQPSAQQEVQAVSCLLLALESISGFKHIERYITQRNQISVCC